MTITYTGPSGVFTHLGSLIARVNSYDTLADTTLPADLLLLLNSFGLTWLPEEGVAAYYEGLKDSVTGWRQGLAGFADRRLLDYSTVLTPLGLDGSAGLDAVLPALHRQMLLDGETVKACACTTTQPVAVGTPAGTGQAFATLTLDGWSAPALHAAPSVWYNGLRSELCVPSETMVLECVADSMQDGLPEGAEHFSWTGGPPYADLDYRDEGSGPGPALQCANGYSLLTGGDMESWSGGVPSGWAFSGGTAGVHLAQDTATFFRGDSSAKFTGDGAANLSLSQPVPSAVLNGKRCYHVSLAVKASGTQAAGALRVQFTGTGYSPAGGEYLQLNGPTFPGAWTIYGFFVNTPAVIPDDFALSIAPGVLSAGLSLWVDSVALAPAVYHGGVAVAVAAGRSRWLKGDRLSFTVTNDQAGKYQSFFRRHYGRQLPSESSGVTQGTALSLPFLLLTSAGAEGIPDSGVA